MDNESEGNLKESPGKEVGVVRREDDYEGRKAMGRGEEG